MSKYFLAISLIVIFIVSGCSHPETISNSSTTYATEKQNFSSGNSWFFAGDNVYLSADVTVNCITAYESGDSSSPTKTQQSIIHVRKLIELQNGSVYKLTIESVEDIDEYLTDARLNIYFYVMPKKIYRIWSYIYEDDTIKEFYDDDQLLIHILDTEEKIIDNSYLIFQENDLPDSLEEGTVGMHNCIENKDNQIESRMWDITENGETYFYESFSWELGKGLTAYRSGFRAEKDILYLNNMLSTNEKD